MSAGHDETVEEQGIYRGEVLAIMGALADLKADPGRFCDTSKARTMGKRKIFRTPEGRTAWETSHEARMRELQLSIDRIRAELAAKGRLDKLPPMNYSV